MSLSQLPAELQIDIFSYLSNCDLKAARLANAMCRDYASVPLFRSVVACMRYQAMGAFQNISLHPDYRNYVKEIVLDGTEYDALLASNCHRYHCMANGYPQLRCSVARESQSSFKIYQLLYQEQEEMKNEQVFLQTVARALDWMPNVSRIVYSPLQRHVPVEGKIMEGIIPRDIVMSLAYRGSSQGLHHLIGALCMTQYSGVREFVVEPYRHLGPRRPTTTAAFDLGHFRVTRADQIEAGKYVFGNLHKVDLELSLRSRTSRAALAEISDQDLCIKNMGILLSEAKGLRHLGLSVQPLSPNPESLVMNGQSPYAPLRLETTWRQLQTLSFRGVYEPEEELRNLILRHKDTLSEVRFTQCRVTSGKWSNVVDDVVHYTSIKTFVLDLVNETLVGNRRFAALPAEEAKQWQYKGELKEVEKGERYFEEAPGSSVFAWRDRLSAEGSTVSH